MTRQHSGGAHVPVLLDEVIGALRIKQAGRYVDGTFGRGGHAAAILDKLGPDGRLLAFDKDPGAIEAARRGFGTDERFRICHGSFAALADEVEQEDWVGKVDGILLDLGVSSPQLDESERGFSFRSEGPLDMRMDPTQGESVGSWLARVSENDLAAVLREFGEERYAKRIAAHIIRARQEAPLTSTRQLAEVVAAANPAWEKHKHPATRTFQALRIFINRELDELKTCLESVVDVLAPAGRLVVISFHSLEDRIVKRFIRNASRGDVYPAGLPVTTKQMNVRLRVVGKAVHPSEQEMASNPRARSAVMRVAEKLA